MGEKLPSAVAKRLQQGVVIPASPLALDSQRRWDPRRQRALWRYYASAGAGGIAIGVHTTQFAIRDPKIGLLEPLYRFAAEELDRLDAALVQKTVPDFSGASLSPGGSAGQPYPGTGAWNRGASASEGRAAKGTSEYDPVRVETDLASLGGGPLVRVAGICGRTEQALAEAELARQCRFHAGLLSLGAMRDADLPELLHHCRRVAEVLPIFGFYLQPAVGGRVLPYRFWREFFELPEVVAVKIAPFNRYQTIDVVRALADSGRDDVALYTGNDDNILLDLLTPFRFQVDGRLVERRIVGGLLGQWACWTRTAVELFHQCRAVAQSGQPVPHELLARNVELTDANSALFDVAHQFAGCIAGIHEVLRRQGLLETNYCLDPAETLSPGQAEEIDRVYRMYPHLADDAFVAEHLSEWLGDG
ncbi:MAG: dihydrodipicolinate synthase family protein [Thermoguttaceae bacterium]|nr:dihydrodipicolinate synthase family protein [Thermoguttaceae bacterium]MDW8039221.1 dihydrodipicolinate synthase family protein [Thermoguttaceae bacterium]